MTPYLPQSESKIPELSLVSANCDVCGGRESDVFSSGHDYEYGTASNLFCFHQCRGCGHLFLNPRPRAEDLSIIYPATYYAFAENQASNPVVGYFRKIWESSKVKEFRRLMGPGPKKILDVGCGEGRFLSLLKEYGDPSWELIGLDFDEKAVALCREKGFRCETGRIENFHGKEQFDAIVMFQLIEHVDSPREVLKSMKTVLHPGGMVILETPNPAGLDFQLFKQSYWGHYHFPRHWHLFTTQNMRRLLEECGYSDVHFSALLSPASWIISLQNRFRDKQCPDFLTRFFYFQNPLLLAFFVFCDLARKAMGLPTSNQRITARTSAP